MKCGLADSSFEKLCEKYSVDVFGLDACYRQKENVGIAAATASVWALLKWIIGWLLFWKRNGLRGTFWSAWAVIAIKTLSPKMIA